jgi:Na+/H+-translocating membrane pyrophosphatase
VVAKAAEIQTAISEGARAFLNTEYQYMGVFGVSDAFASPLHLRIFSRNAYGCVQQHIACRTL